MSEAVNQMRWTVPARRDQAGPLRRLVTAYAEGLGMPAARLNEVALGVGEAIANAVVHAYRDRPLGTVDVVARVRGGQLVVSVRDQGCGLVPRSDSPGLGLGLGVISQVADALRIRRGDHGGTEVDMTFALTSPLTTVSTPLPNGGGSEGPELRWWSRASRAARPPGSPDSPDE